VQQADGLNRLGRELASRKGWGKQEADVSNDRSNQVIRCTPAGGDSWSIRVSDAVGVIAVEDLQIVVEPKIPPRHLIYLLEASGQTPRLGESTASLAMDSSFWELVARWYVAALEQLLRLDLVRDYRSQRDRLGVVRGRVDAAKTALALLHGEALISCEFDEFDQDNALNRVLLAAARAVAGSVLLTYEVRRRALRVASRMSGIGTLRPGDLTAVLERRTAHYREPIALAANVLAGDARALEHGRNPARSFLFRTPDLVEEGLRRCVAALLAPRWQVEKRGLRLGNTPLTFTPDLLFNEGLATGDVKYKLAQPEWNQADLYQAVAFATAFRARAAVVVSFRTPGARTPAPVPVGPVRVAHITWRADDEIAPADAASELAANVDQWLTKVRDDGMPEFAAVAD
jgi:5-methylcytosine-specific restriction endonuclease McrBC regulatory subunit McrC